MGLGDRLKGLREQAQQAVVENRDKIQDAVQVVGEAANAKTHGKYAAKIAKVGAKVEESVDRVAAGEPRAGGASTGPIAHEPPDPAGPVAGDTAGPASGDTAGGSFPEFG